MNGNLIASVIAILMALVLAVRGVRNHRESPKRLLLMAGTWMVILVVVVLLINTLGFAPPF